MKSGLNNSVTQLENTRQRRMNRIRRQRAIEAGKPVDVSLKSMALNSAQQKDLSNLQLRPHVNLRHQTATPNRVSIVVALGIHLIAVLLGAIYIVSPTRLDAEATIVDIVHSIPTHPRRAPQPIHDFGDDNHLLDDRIRNIGSTRPDAFVTLEITRMAIFSKRIEPIYPSEAKRAGKEGKVVLEATIDEDGKVKDITVKEDTVGFGCARAAIQALKASRFNPAKRGGESVAQRITIPYTFKIED
jgi:TonB family protein